MFLPEVSCLNATLRFHYATNFIQIMIHYCYKFHTAVIFQRLKMLLKGIVHFGLIFILG